MKLSDIVARLNLLDSLDVASECDTATAKLSHITHVIAQQVDSSVEEEILKTFEKLSHTISKYSAQIETLKQDLRTEIVRREREYIENSLHVYREEMIHDSPNTILHRRMRINDDDDLILYHFKSISDLSHLSDAFTTPYFDTYYRPLVTVSLIVDAQISGMSAWMYHCSNLIYHLIASGLTFLLLIRIQSLVVPQSALSRSQKTVALLAGMLFAINPIVTQTVAWIPGRNDSLFTIFVLLSLIALIRFVSTNRIQHFVFHLLSFFLALLTKETALVFPLLCLYFLHFVARVPFISRKTALYGIGWSFMIAVWYLMRALALSEVHGVFTVSALIPNIRVLPELVGKIVIPLRLSAYPTFDSLSLAAGIATIVVFIMIMITYRESRTHVGMFALLWIILFIVVSSFRGMVTPRYRFDYLECRAYASVVGLSVFIIGLFQNSSSKIKRWGWRLFLLAAAVYAIVSINYSSNFQDPVSHWTHAVRMSPQSDLACFTLGKVFMDVGKNPDQAMESYRKAIALNPNDFGYHNELALAYCRKGFLDEAELEFKRAIQLNPPYPFTHANLGFLYLWKNDLPEAERYLKETVALDSTITEAQVSLVTLYSREKKYDQMRYYVEKLKKVGINANTTAAQGAESSGK